MISHVECDPLFEICVLCKNELFQLIFRGGVKGQEEFLQEQTFKKHFKFNF